MVNQSAANGNGCLSFAPNGSSIAQDCSAAIGYACERRVNRASVSLCASSLCDNGGTCTESGCHYHCICKHPFIGSNCKTFLIVDAGSQASLSPLFYILPICGAVLLLVAILLIMRTKRRRNTSKQQAVHFVPEQQNQPVEEVPIQQEAVYENLAIETYSETHVIPMAQLPAMLKDMFKERSRITLVTQFKNLLETAARFQDVEVTVASLPENKSKNRFKNILPFDNTRVVLSDDGSGNDYINANYIDCYSVPGKYIATQGPLQKTEADFWRMIWETESSTIVMLTNLFEKGKKKCQKYWPDFGSQRDFKQIRIACTQEEVVGCFVKRNFTINLPEDTRDVTQFHYTTWPDHSVPITTTGLHRLKQAVLEHHRKSGEDKPIVVHCSAGAGRTGCFIAFDSLTMEMRERSSINVFETVINLRKQRMDMVQTQSQYMFLHKLMAEVHVLGHTDVPMMHLESKIKELERSKRGVKSGYSVEMGKLVSLHFNERSLKYARDNNDNDIIVSYDHSRITPGINKESSYYNASFIEGYGQNERVLIAAKGPTAASIENFWYAIMANQVHTIVSLRSREEESMDPWFPFMNQPTRQTDDLTLSILDEKEIGNGITKRSLVISQSKHAKFDISFYQLTSWMPDTVPNNANDVLELIKKAQESRNELKGRILVYCNDGAGRTGAFLCILNLIERAKLEGRVDVLREVKDMRDMRVGMLHSELLYRFVYYCMAEYISTFDVYANFTG